VGDLPRGPAKKTILGQLADTSQREEKFTPGFLAQAFEVKPGYVASTKHSNKKKKQDKKQDSKIFNEPSTGVGKASKTKQVEKPELLQYPYPPNTTKDSTPDEVRSSLLQFYTRTSTNFSGERSATRHIELAEWQISQHLYANWPVLLRENCPLLLKKAQNKQAGGKGAFSKLEASVLAAVAWAKQPSFEAATERKERLDRYAEWYRCKLKRQQLRRAVTNSDYANLERNTQGQISDAVLDKHLGQADKVGELGFDTTKCQIPVSDFDPLTYAVHPPCEDTVKVVLAKAKFKYTHKSYPKECPICSREGVAEAEKKLVEDRMAELRQKDTCDWTDQDKRLLVVLKKCHKDLVEETKLILVHKTQLHTCRAFIKNLASNLKHGEIIIWRDFVNQYTCGVDADQTGNQLKNLVLVMVWREKGNTHTQVFHHFCTDPSSYSTDSSYVADVFDYHLHPKSHEYPGTLDQFHTLYLCGDHGGHFSCLATMYNESTWYAKYGKKVTDFFLASYHAFNLCDGAGVPPARIAMSLNKEGYTLLTSGDYAIAVQNSNSSCIALDFSVIRRDVGFFPPSLKIRGDAFDPEFDANIPLKRFCEVRYAYYKPGGQLACLPREVWLHLLPFMPNEERVLLLTPVRVAGYVRVATYPGGQSQPRLLDLLPADSHNRKADAAIPFCAPCTASTQWPEYCRKDHCPTMLRRVKEAVMTSDMLPGPGEYKSPPMSRLAQKQVRKKTKQTKKKKKGGPTTSYYCPVANCQKHTYPYTTKTHLEKHVSARHAQAWVNGKLTITPTITPANAPSRSSSNSNSSSSTNSSSTGRPSSNPSSISSSSSSSSNSSGSPSDSNSNSQAVSASGASTARTLAVTQKKRKRTKFVLSPGSDDNDDEEEEEEDDKDEKEEDDEEKESEGEGEEDSDEDATGRGLAPHAVCTTTTTATTNSSRRRKRQKKSKDSEEEEEGDKEEGDFRAGDSVAVQCSDDVDSSVDVVWYAMVKGRSTGKPGQRQLQLEFFEALDEDYGGCYGVYNGLVNVDEEDIIGRVDWVACDRYPKCQFHLGDEQFDKFTVLLEQRFESE
jgi:hypothetical protein